MELVTNDNLQAFVISFIASLLVVILSKLMYSMFVRFTQENKRSKFYHDLAIEISNILKSTNEELTEKKIIRIYRSLLLQNEINFPIILEKEKILDLVYIKLSSEIASNRLESIIDNLEKVLKKTENEIQRIDAKFIDKSNTRNINFVYALILFGLVTLLLAFGIFYYVIK